MLDEFEDPGRLRQRDETAARLRRLIPEIMRTWEQHVRTAVPAAEREEHLQLLDDLPQIVQELSQTLAIGREELFTESEASRAHAHQRAESPAYTLDQVIHEYQVLRRVLVARLREVVPLDDAALALIHATIDQSIQEAATEFVRLQQQALKQSEERYRLLVDGVKDYALLLLDPEGRVTSWNPGAARMFGYPETEILGDSFTRFFPPQERGDGVPEIQLREAREKEICEAEGWRVRRDRTQFWAHTVITPLHHPSGELRGFAAVARDMTERKLLEDQLLRHAEDLAEADRRKNEFLAMLAHELRTPLSAIMNAFYILENIELDERAVRQLGTATRQTRQLARLVEDLMDVSRIKRGKIELRKERVSLCRIARDAAQGVEPFVEARGQSLVCDVTTERLTVEGDPVRLLQVVSNLLSNAAKYTEPGGTIWLTVFREGERAVVRVRDTGIGIAAPMLPQIFDLFTQVDPSEARSHGGLGIGLTLVRRLVELHGGTVTADSPGEGQGAEFTVRLPLAAPAS